MRRIRQIATFVLLAAFWLAQAQGTIHAIGHLNQAAGVSDQASVAHGLVCLECAAYAQAGAAPVASVAQTQPALPADTFFPRFDAQPRVSALGASYQSRAPPVTPS